MNKGHFLRELHTDRLSLLKLSIPYADEFSALLQDKEVAATTLMLPFPCSKKEAGTIIREYLDEEKHRKSMRWGIFLEDKMIGGIRLVPNLRFNSAEVGFWLGRDYWRNGYTYEAAKAVINFGFEELKFNRIEAHSMTENRSSILLLEKLGFTQEGYHPDLVIKWGEYKDVLTFGLLRKNYQKFIKTTTQLTHQIKQQEGK